MANSYLPVERDQVFLLPPDMREWLPQDHLVWFLLDLVARMDLTALHARRGVGGVGRRGYDPSMLLALLLYAYCTGQRSSRQIERLCEVDVAYRVICAGWAPDHTTIARFRQEHAEQALQLFTDALVVCREAGLATVGVVAVDGTKMGTDASLKANHGRGAIERQARTMLEEAEAVDAEDDRLFGAARGDELPAGLRERSSRRQRLDAALAVIAERERRAAAAPDAARWEAAAWEAAERGEGFPGRPPAGVDPVTVARIRVRRSEQKAAKQAAARQARAAAAAAGEPLPAPCRSRDPQLARARAALEHAEREAAHAGPVAKATKDGDARPAQANTTDPESRTMSTANGWIQGYNAQAAVNDHGVVVAADVTQDHSDVQQCQPMIAALLTMLAAAGITAQVGMLLFDAGYWSHANARADGPDRLIATRKDWKRRKQLREQGTVSGPPPPDANPAQAMEHRLCTPEGAALYAKRGTTVEPAFGDIKHNRGFRSFVRRGLDAARAEWLLITATGNLLRAYQHTKA